MGAFDDLGELEMLPLFSGIPRDQLRLLNARLGRIALPSGNLLMSADQPGDRAYVVLAGTLRVLLADAEGDEITLALLGPGEIVGEMALIDDDVRSATVVALEPVSLLCLDRTTFEYCRHNVSRLVDNLIRILARRLRHTNAQVLALATRPVPGRVARQLLLLAEAYGRPDPAGIRIELRLTQEDIGHLVGATRVRVNQALGQFRRNRLLSVDEHHRFVIRDADGLAEYV